MIEDTNYDKYCNHCDTAVWIGSNLEKMLKAYYGCKRILINEDPDHSTVTIRTQNNLFCRPALYSTLAIEDLEPFWAWMDAIRGELPMYKKFLPQQDRIEDQLAEAREVVEELRESQKDVD